jgi:hypothetical protein
MLLAVPNSYDEDVTIIKDEFENVLLFLLWLL